MSELPTSASTSDAPVDVGDASEAAKEPYATPLDSEPSRGSDEGATNVGVKGPSRFAKAKKRLVDGLRILVQPPNEQHALLALLQAVVLFALLGMAIGAYVWWVTHWNDFGKHATANTLPLKTRNLMFRYFVGGAVAVTSISGLWNFLSGRSFELWRRVAVRVSPAILLGMTPVIFNRATWTSRELPGLLLVL